jgi:hypothetical protein
MPVKFDINKIYDRARQQTVESAIKAYANWAGVHDFDFYDAYQSDEIAITPIGSAWEAVSIGEAPINHVVEYHVNQVSGHAVWFMRNSSTDGYIAGVTPGGKCYVGQFVSGSLLDKYVCSPAIHLATEADMIASFTQIRMSDNNDDFWDVITLYMNDAVLLTFMQHRGLAANGNQSVALAASTDPITFTNVRIPLMADHVEWASLDPGESPQGGLNRVLEGRYVEHLIRWNGKMRAWYNRSIPASMAIADEDIFSKNIKTDTRELYSHVRMMGAYEQAEYHDEEITRKYGHRFVETTNPYLMTPEECYHQAQEEIKRMKSAAFTSGLDMSYTPFLEPGDRVQTSDGDWLLAGYDWSYENGSIMEQQLSLKGYFYG